MRPQRIGGGILAGVGITFGALHRADQRIESPGEASSAMSTAPRPPADPHNAIQWQALIFDQLEKYQAAPVDAVRNRHDGESVIDVLRHYSITSGAAEFSDAAMAESFLSQSLVRDTLDLREYVRRVLDRQKEAVASAIAEATGVPADDESCVVLAHVCIEALACNHERPDPQQAIDIAFYLIENGWNNLASKPSPPGGGIDR